MRITKHLHPGKHPRHIDTQTSSVQTFLVETAAVNVNAHAGTRHRSKRKRKKRDRTKGSRDLSPRHRKGRSKCVEERMRRGWRRDRRTPSKRRNTSSVHLFSFHETRIESRYDRYYPRSSPVKHAPEMKSFTCYILSTVLDNRARSRTKRTIEREHANRPFRFLLRKSNGFA